MKTWKECVEEGPDIYSPEDCTFEKGPCPHESSDEKEPKSKTMRRCLVLRRVAPKEHLIRFVAAPDGTVVPDLRCSLPGRGVWVTAQRAVVDQAVSRGVFSHGLRSGVKVSPTLGQEVDAYLERLALQALGFANKAGACRVGHNQVSEALKSGKVVSLFAASEASEDQWNKLDQLASSLDKRSIKLYRSRLSGECEFASEKSEKRPKLHVFRGFSTDQLSQIFGKSGIFYGALLDHVGNKGYLVCVNRLMWYRTSSSS